MEKGIRFDISVIQANREDFRDSHPTTAEWVIEVAISSLSLDLGKSIQLDWI